MVDHVRSYGEREIALKVNEIIDTQDAKITGVNVTAVVAVNSEAEREALAPYDDQTLYVVRESE